jgi:hypothetical protein
MAHKERYYSDSDDLWVMSSQLKRLGKARKREYMLHWFHRNFEDPAQETPWSSKEGGYLYIWGGPYKADEVLHEEFGALVTEELIEEVAEEVQREGIYWAPGPDHPDHRRHEEEWREEMGEEPTEATPDIDHIIRELEAGLVPRYGDGYEIELRQKILERIERLKDALRIVTPPKHGQIGHNRPPPDDDTPQAQVVTQIQAASDVLQQELKKERPDALAIAHATSKIKSALGYLTKKVDVAVDSFAKTIGASVAVGATAVATSQLSPTFYKLLAEIAQHTLQWLGHIMLPF